MPEKPTYEELEQQIRELEKIEIEQKKVEATLRESEERLRIAGKLSHDLIYEWTVAGDTLEWFGDIDTLLGYEQGAISRNISAWLSLIHPEERNRLEQAVEIHRTSTSSILYEYRIKHKDGTYRYWKDHGLPLLDKQGHTYKWVGVCADITAQKKIEQVLQENEEKFRLAFHTSPDSINLNRLEDGLYIDINDGFSEIMGYTREEVIGKTSLALSIWDNPRDRDRLTSELKKNRRVENLEAVFRKKNGELKTGLMSARLITLCNEDIILSITRDITKMKWAENAIRESEKNYRHLFDSIRDAIVVADVDRNINACNKAFTQMFGYTSEEVRGKKTVCVYETKEKYEAVGKEIRKNMDQPFFSYTISYKKKSGDVFFGETNIFFLKNETGAVLGFVAVIKDITLRKTMEDSLLTANEDLKQKTIELENINTALDILLKKREQDNLEIEAKIFSNYESVILPFLNRLRNSLSTKNQHQLADLLEKGLKEVISPFAKKLSDPLIMLTPSEIHIASMIKQGLSNKDIAQTLGLSTRTIDTHRANIREKLELKNKKLNLRAYLSTL